jgi:hypothetical protein
MQTEKTEGRVTGTIVRLGNATGVLCVDRCGAMVDGAMVDGAIRVIYLRNLLKMYLSKIFST